MAFMGVLIAAGLFYVVFLIWLGVLVLGVVLLVWGFCLRCFMGGIREGWGLREWGRRSGRRWRGLFVW